MRTAPVIAACLILLASAFAQQGKQKASAMPSGKAVLEAYVSAWNRHDFAALDKLLTPDAVHEDIAWPSRDEGPAQVKKFMQEMIALMPDFDWRLTNVVDGGSVVAAEWTWTATYTGDCPPIGHVAGKQGSGRGASVAVIENGRIRRFSDYYDFASFCRALAGSAKSEAAKSAQAAPDKEVENQIVALEKRLWNGDANDVLKLEADDYEAIKHSHRYDRDDDTAAAKDVKFALIAMDNIRVKMLSPDVALMTYHATQKGTFRGTEVPPSLYFGSLWVKRNGEWKNVFLEENLPDAFTESYKPAALSDPKAAALPVAAEPKNSETLPPDVAKQQVLDLEKEWVAAEVKHDATTLRRILDDKFLASFGAKNPYDKEAFIRGIVAGDVDPTESQTLTDETVVIDQDTAVVVGTDTLRGTKNGAAYTVVGRYTVTYIRRHGQWVALAEHLVEVPQAK